MQQLLSTSILQAKNSECLAYRDVQMDVSLALWGNREDHVVVQNQGFHTLSVYLEGGEDASRSDLHGVYGGPGKVSLMPAEHVSEWDIDSPLRFLHLYFTTAHLDYLGLTALDLDPRLLELPDLTFLQDSLLSQGLQAFAQSIESIDGPDILRFQEIQQQLLIYLLQVYARKTAKSVQGGLSPRAQRRVFDYIDAHLDQVINLEQMAEVACLSTYHFARMFKQSTGLSPYQYVLKKRLDKAAGSLQQGVTVKDVATDCGYENHSRFARAFSKAFGVTPKVYQSCVQS